MTRREVWCIVGLAALIAVASWVSADVLGFIASVIAFILFIPQAQNVWKSRHDAQSMAVVSLDTQVLLLANAVIWAIYAVQTQAFWVGAPGLVNAPLAVMVMVLILRARRRVTIAVNREQYSVVHKL